MIGRARLFAYLMLRVSRLLVNSKSRQKTVEANSECDNARYKRQFGDFFEDKSKYALKTARVPPVVCHSGIEKVLLVIMTHKNQRLIVNFLGRWCPRGESNSHSQRETDFESAASTNSATGAGTYGCVAHPPSWGRIIAVIFVRSMGLCAKIALSTGWGFLREKVIAAKGQMRLHHPHIGHRAALFLSS